MSFRSTFQAGFASVFDTVFIPAGGTGESLMDQAGEPITDQADEPIKDQGS